jgi:hypothetical protein
MDIVSHGLWSAAAAIGARRKLPAKIKVRWAAWWGVFPDLFAFTVPVGLGLWQRITSGAVPVGGPRGMPHMSLASDLYRVSHSLVIFAAVFGLVWLVARRPVLELLAWLLHVLMDIPTHTLRFFPTPFLWPISSFRASGISWGNRWFMLSNYSALAVVYLLLWLTRRYGTSARNSGSAQDSDLASNRSNPQRQNPQ